MLMCKTFEFDLNWCRIYRYMIGNIHVPIVSELNYKLLHNLLGTRSLVCKWDNSIDKFCVRCRESKETPKHIIYDCQNFANIWKTISVVLQFDIKKNI